MTAKRDLSIVSLIKALAKEDVAVCITLPNGTEIRTLTPANSPGSSADPQNEAPVQYGAFAKKVRKS